jgi:hypothetical protein
MAAPMVDNWADCWETHSAVTTVAQKADKTVDTTELPMAASWAGTKAVRSEQRMVASMVAMTAPMKAANWAILMAVHWECRSAASSAPSMAATTVALTEPYWADLRVASKAAPMERTMAGS